MDMSSNVEDSIKDMNYVLESYRDLDNAGTITKEAEKGLFNVQKENVKHITSVVGLEGYLYPHEQAYKEQYHDVP